MRTSKWIRTVLSLTLIIQVIFSALVPGGGAAAAGQLNPPITNLPLALDPITKHNSALAMDGPPEGVHFDALAAPLFPDTTLDVSILSTPWATLDSKPDSGGDLPQVFVIEAAVTNTGAFTATNVSLTLDYQEVGDWVLLLDEHPDRTFDLLEPGETYYGYWMARYPNGIGNSHQYTVFADADNAPPVSTSENFYIPEPDRTVTTRSTLSTGNSGITQVSADTVVGVVFTVTVDYDLGSNPQEVVFSPVGNIDFNPSAYRLLKTQVHFYDDAGTWDDTIDDQLFFNVLHPNAENALVFYTFIPQKSIGTRLCSYAAVSYASNDKYDQFFCTDGKDTIIPITGTLSMSMTKQANAIEIQQGEVLTYSINYTNTGDLPLSYAWIWDEVDSSIASVRLDSISPTPTISNSNLVAWYLGDIPAIGLPGSTGTFTFSVDIDGNGAPLADNTLLVNESFYGVNQGSLPIERALTSTFTTTVQAPEITISKTDGLPTAEPGDLITYTLHITNSGSIAASGLVITDVLPADVTLFGLPSPEPDNMSGQPLVWTNLGPLAPSGGTASISIPVILDDQVSNETVLTNTMSTQYENSVGYLYEPQTTMDTTLVNGPVLSITKSDYPNPVLAGTTLTYTLSYLNTGPGAATNVVITDTVPLSTTYQDCTGCTMANGVVSWDIADLAGHTGDAVSFTVLVDDSLETGTTINNNDYGITSDQTGFIGGPPVTTTVNREAAIIEGFTFVDANGDGLYDMGTEAFIDGLTLTMTNATVPVTTSDAAGYYRFRVEVPGPDSVSAELPADTFRTTPGTVNINARLGITETVSFGYAPITSTFGVVYGTVFADENHDEMQTLGEDGLSGVEVTSDQAVTQTVTTNALGQYTLRFDTSDTITITETNPPNYVSTTPDIVQTAVITGSSNSSPIDFGDFLGIKIVGQVFEDTDVDGVKDAGETTGISGANLDANGVSFTTGASGDFTLYAHLTGSDPVLIVETDPTGYQSTNAIPGTSMSRVDANTLRIDLPTSGEVYSDTYFGDVIASGVITVSGNVWNDNGAGGGSLANGQWERDEPGFEGEPPLAGAVVSLSSGLTQTTGIDGAFLLYAPPDQVITVTESNPTGYISTNAIPGNDSVKLNHDTLLVGPLAGGATSTDNLFGDVQISSVAIITGTVFEDANLNGILDGVELGLPGVTVTLETYGGNPISLLTDSNGDYQFAVAPGTDVRITSSGPDGLYYPTTPESFVARPPAADVYPDNDFGYFNDNNSAVVYGIVFDDFNGNGQQDLGESGLAGAVITLTNSGPPITTTTGGSGLITGTFAFTVTQAGFYTVLEQNPPGYRSTTPDRVVVEVSLDGSNYVEFGDTNRTDTASIYGTVFDDLNSNGFQDSNEIALEGVLITVTVGTQVLTATTKAQGQYAYGIETHEAGVHRVTEQDPAKPGYRSTTPDSIVVSVEIGNSYTVNFGDTQNLGFSTITGIVFNDSSGDGVQDLNELGIPGVLLSLSNGITTTTGQFGAYSFGVSDTSFIQVSETDPPGFHSTTPNQVSVNIVSLGSVYNVDFGDSDNASSTSFYGTVFNDLNVNGLREMPLELGLSGVTVTISGSSTPYLTNQWGQYTFLIESTGTYTVTETDLPGYFSTNAIPGSPAITKVDNNSLLADVTSFGADLGDNLFGDVQSTQVITVSGVVWDDNGAGGGVAGDGFWDAGEPPLSGAVISLNSGLSQTTASDGAFQLIAPSGVITVTETNPAGYISTNAVSGTGATKIDNDTLVISGLAGGSTSTGNFFGDVQPADLSIAKNGDPDPVAAGGILTYTLTFANAGPSDAQGVTITDTLPAEVEFGGLVSVDAPFSFSGQNGGQLVWDADTLVADAGGTIVFTVTVQPDAVGGIANTVLIDSHTLDDNHDNNLASSNTVIGVPGMATIYGYVFDDVDGDGVWDGAESGIPGVLITLDGTITTTTDLNGRYYFLTDLPGIHTVIEEDPSGYFSTTPNEIHVDVLLGDSYRVDFGDARITSDFAIIYGTVFDDFDSDGVWDANEVGIPGVTVTLDDVFTTTTDQYGSYSASTTVPGLHRVVETDPEGFSSTTPNEVHITVEIGQGYEVDFGDIQKCTCAPDEFEEDDTWDQAQLIQLGVAYSQTHDFCDDAVDWLKFTAQAGEAYTITTTARGQRADTLLGLYDSDGVTLLAANDDYDPTDYSSRIVWQAPADGVYFIRVDNRAGLNCCDTEYDIWIETPQVTSHPIYLPLVTINWVVTQSDDSHINSPTGVISHMCPDPFEIDDTWDQAHAIEIGVLQTHSFDSNPAVFAADKDLVSFDIQSGQTVIFSIETLTNTQTLLELYDQYGFALDVTGTTELTWTATNSGRYYLSVSPMDDTSFGCSDVAGYDLVMEMDQQQQHRIALPLLMK